MSEQCKRSADWEYDDENIGAGLNSYFGFENVRFWYTAHWVEANVETGRVETRYLCTFHVLAKIRDQLNQFDPAATVPLLACFNWRSIDRILETSFTFFALLGLKSHSLATLSHSVPGSTG